jgi:hypothetical protein
VNTVDPKVASMTDGFQYTQKASHFHQKKFKDYFLNIEFHLEYKSLRNFYWLLKIYVTTRNIVQIQVLCEDEIIKINTLEALKNQVKNDGLSDFLATATEESFTLIRVTFKRCCMWPPCYVIAAMIY